MQFYILLLIIAESFLLLIISIILFRKSSQINKLLQTVKDLSSKDSGFAEGMTSEHDFIPVLVHEMRAPLSVIKGAADLLLKEATELSADQIHTLLGQIKTSSSSLLKIVNDILDVSKIGAGRLEINKVFADLNDVLKEETSYFDALAKVKKINLTIDLEPDVPKFSFDPERIKQVMNNLISNALKYTLEGGTITVLSRKYDHHIEVTVADTGLGIPEKDKPYLFHKFFQASNHTSVAEKGSGLGLVICKGIVEAHKGSIRAEDNVPKGAKFVFDLPLR